MAGDPMGLPNGDIPTVRASEGEHMGHGRVVYR